MATINNGRVVIGGFVASLVMSVRAKIWEEGRNRARSACTALMT